MAGVGDVKYDDGSIDTIAFGRPTQETGKKEGKRKKNKYFNCILPWSQIAG